jgi:hypothetical protein
MASKTVWHKIAGNFFVQGADGKTYHIQSSGIGYGNGVFRGTLRFFDPSTMTTSVVFKQPGAGMSPNSFNSGDLTFVNGGKQLTLHIRNGNQVAFSYKEDGREVVATSDPRPVQGGLTLIALNEVAHPNPV